MAVYVLQLCLLQPPWCQALLLQVGRLPVPPNGHVPASAFQVLSTMVVVVGVDTPQGRHWVYCMCQIQACWESVSEAGSTGQLLTTEQQFSGQAHRCDCGVPWWRHGVLSGAHSKAEWRSCSLLLKEGCWA